MLPEVASDELWDEDGDARGEGEADEDANDSGVRREGGTSDMGNIERERGGEDSLSEDSSTSSPL